MKAFNLSYRPSKLVSWSMEPGHCYWWIRILQFLQLSWLLENVIQDLKCQLHKNSINFSQFMIICDFMCITYVEKICFLIRLINSAVYQDVPDHFPISYNEDKFWDNEFSLQNELTPLHRTKSIKNGLGRWW